jgi:hypothetical protein
MVAEWVKRHWDVLVIIAVVIGSAVFFGWLYLRPFPVPPGY